MKTKKPKITGITKLNGKFVKCLLVKRFDTGRKKLKLLEDCFAYKEGETVIVGTGEFVKDD